jgi:hypothetical protein
MFQPEVLFGVGIVVLFLGLLWGFVQYKTRNKANDPLTDAATKAEYDDPHNYDVAEAELKSKIQPS